MQLRIHSAAESCAMLLVALTPDDIDALVEDLLALKKQPEQHFHLTHSGDDYIDIEISMQPETGDSNASRSSFAIEPDA